MMAAVVEKGVGVGKVSTFLWKSVEIIHFSKGKNVITPKPKTNQAVH
jgi:hypothetical protein